MICIRTLKYNMKSTRYVWQYIYICMILYIYILWFTVNRTIYIYVYIAFTVHNRILVYMTMYYVINHDSTVIVLLPYYLPKITNWYINIEHINIDKSHIYIYTQSHIIIYIYTITYHYPLKETRKMGIIFYQHHGKIHHILHVYIKAHIYKVVPPVINWFIMVINHHNRCW